MTGRLSSSELLEMEQRFKKMQGATQPSSMSQAEMRVLENRFLALERNAAIRDARRKLAAGAGNDASAKAQAMVAKMKRELAETKARLARLS